MQKSVKTRKHILIFIQVYNDDISYIFNYILSLIHVVTSPSPFKDTFHIVEIRYKQMLNFDVCVT